MNSEKKLRERFEIAMKEHVQAQRSLKNCTHYKFIGEWGLIPYCDCTEEFFIRARDARRDLVAYLRTQADS